MAKPLPDWRAAFLDRHQLPHAYLDSAQKWFAPVVGIIAEHQNGAGRTLLVGVNGSQGSGKTTFCDYVRDTLEQEYKLSALSLSLDDFYLTRDQREALARDVHPLLSTRGVPGTHDMTLLLNTLRALLRGEACRIPRFDKSVDDRVPQDSWDSVEAEVDVVLLEGWCLGATSQDPAELSMVINELEAAEDGDGHWRQYVNNKLGESFPELYQLVDEWVMLKAPSFDCIHAWRLEQEQKLAARTSGKGIMTEPELARFIQFYQRITQQCLAQLPHKVNHLFVLDEMRTIQSYMAAPGSRF